MNADQVKAALKLTIAIHEISASVSIIRREDTVWEWQVGCLRPRNGQHSHVRISGTASSKREARASVAAAIDVLTDDANTIEVVL